MIFLNSRANNVTVVMTAMISAIGSARKTARTLSVIKDGRMKISGIKSTILRKTARKALILEFPKAIKLCWQEI